MRAEIKRLHIDQHATTVYVTHDQVEAMAMGDRIVVMSEAEIQQVGSSNEVYYDPANLFVANFIGSPGMNLVSGSYMDGIIHMPGAENRYPAPNDWRAPLGETLQDSGDVIVGFRPECAEIVEDGTLAGNVYTVDLYGAYSMLAVNMNEQDIIHIRGDRLIQYPIGMQMRFDIDPQMVRFFDPATEKTIKQEAVK